MYYFEASWPHKCKTAEAFYSKLPLSLIEFLFWIHPYRSCTYGDLQEWVPRTTDTYPRWYENNKDLLISLFSLAKLSI